jgi:hypothetical protein
MRSIPPHSDEWEDYDNADAEGKKYLKAKWGDPETG